MRPRPLLLLALLLLPAGIAPAQDSPRTRIPIEEYLPADTLVLLSVPTAARALELLAETGEDADALAARLAGRLPKRAMQTAGDVRKLIDAVVAAADGPVTFSRHRIKLPGRESEDTWLVSAFTGDRKDALRTAGLELVKKGIAPTFFKAEGTERLMELTVHHLAGARYDLYIAYSRGFLVLSPSVLTMGRVLREMQSPYGRSLKYRPEFESAREAAGAKAEDAFLYVRGGDPLPGGATAQVATAYGVLRADGKDEVVVRSAAGGVGTLLRDDVPIPGKWADGDAPASELWLSGALSPKAIFRFAVDVVGEEHAIHATWLEDVADGTFELLWSPGAPPLVRLGVADGKDASVAAAPLGGQASVPDEASIVIGRDPSAVGAGAARKARDSGQRGGARLEAPLGTVLALLGRDGATSGARVVWEIRPADGGLTVRPVGDSVGPVRAFLVSLFR